MNTKILSLNCILSLPNKRLPEKYPDVLLIDPVNPLAIVPWILCAPHENTLKSDDFSNLAYAIQGLKVWINHFLDQGGLVLVILRPYTCFYHGKHADLKIGNYDWLWEEAGQDNNLKIIPNQSDIIDITEYGCDSPFNDYLQQKKLCYEVAVEGNLHSLAINRFRKSLAFFLMQNKGKIVFLPRARTQTAKICLLKAIENALNKENWPETEVLKEVKHKWIKEYFWPESTILEEMLAKKEEEISLLEEECEEIHEKLCHFNQIRNSLFCCNASTLGNALASILVQWGIEVFPKGQILEIVSGNQRGFILVSVSKKEAEVWRAKKLSRMIPDSYKGILVVNSYCYEHPKKKPVPLYSTSFVDFAKESNFSIVDIRDIIQAHQQGDKNLMDKIWTTRGLVKTI